MIIIILYFMWVNSVSYTNLPFFGLLAPKDLNYLVFQSYDWVYLMKVNLMTEYTWWRSILWLSIPDEGQSYDWVYLMKVNLMTMSIPDEGQSYDWAYLMKVNLMTERTWWRSILWLWAYLMKVNLMTMIDTFLNNPHQVRS
jgi:hypothetical protein